MNKKLLLHGSIVLLGLPAIILAQAVPFPGVNTFAIDNLLTFIVNLIWIVFATLAVVMFIAAGIMFLSSQGEPSKTAQARQFVIWGIVGVGVALISVSIPFIVKLALGV